MKTRKFIVLLLIVSFVLPLNASVILTRDNRDYGDFASPASLVDIDKTTHFGFEAELISDIDELNFLMDPVSAFEDSVEVVADYLASQDIDFWYDNPNLVSSLSSIDPAFPLMSGGDELFLAEIKDYFKGRFLSKTYGANNRTLALADIFDNGVYPPKLASSVGGDMDIALRIYGGRIKNGFGWDLRFDLYLDSLDSLLSNYTDGDYTYGNDLVAEVSSNIGFASYVIDDVLAIGLSVAPNLYFKTSFLNSDIINARMDDQILNIFASNNYYFGAGVGLNFGVMYKPLENLTLNFDLRNAPSIKGAIYFSASDVAANDFKLRTDKNIYFVPPDLAVSASWDYGVWHVEGEIGDILSQLVWLSKVDGFRFKWQYIPKVKVTYDMSDTLSLSLGYEKDIVSLGFITGDFKAELLTKVDRFAIGINVGYEF